MQMVRYVIQVLWDVTLVLDEWFWCLEGVHYIWHNRTPTVKAPCSFKRSGTTHAMAWCRIPDEWILSFPAARIWNLAC